jgi:hypothetical protein
MLNLNNITELGHSFVVTTEKQYAPLMATEIEEFIL